MKAEHKLTVRASRPSGRAVVDSLFVPGGTLACLERVRYCTGKYRESIIGREVAVPTYVRALWAERRKDRDGPYRALFALVAKGGSDVS